MVKISWVRQRREPERRFVEHEELRTAHQRPADGEHLLLAAAEMARLLVLPLLQDRKVLKDMVDVILDPLPVPPGIGAHHDVFQDGELRETPPGPPEHS